ncbi:MAG: hypothetical protein ABL994_04420 [Verrucomicrobiales bacterium]
MGFPLTTGVCILIALTSLASPVLVASPASDEKMENDQVTSSGLSLPVWEEGETGESFDIRIWPESVMVWLEQENLRDLIADPNTPESEKQELKRILAMQRAWRVSDSN